jgi:HD-GYP domain-containing protein (c-di-GMP phosphodiesterase class II)
MHSNTSSILKANIQKKLLFRLTGIGICISIVIGVIVNYTNRNDVGDPIIDRLAQATQRFNQQAAAYLNTDGPLNHAGIREEFYALLDTKSYALKVGRYVYAGVYDASNHKIVDFSDEKAKHIKEIQEYMELTSHALTFEKDTWSEVKRYRGDILVRTAAPLINGNGKEVAHIEGVFALSPSVLAAIRYRIIRGTLLGIAIVVVTSALMYPIILNLLGRLSTLTINLLDANMETLQTLGCAIAKRDSDTDAHNYRVTIFSVRLAEAAGLDRPTIQKLIKGAFLHDVGKIGVRDNILLKPGKLDADEFEIMKTHVSHGLDIVSRSEWLLDAVDVVGRHHEKYDGSGYGRHKPGSAGVKGEAIPVAARIFAIADVFDALTSKRPYKEPFSFEKSIEILLEGSGSHFDSVLLKTFIQIARPLYDKLSGHDDDVPPKELETIIDVYFSQNAAFLMQ